MKRASFVWIDRFSICRPVRPARFALCMAAEQLDMIEDFIGI
jgi:hypothetical protein